MPTASRPLSPRRFFILKAALFLLCLIPAAAMLARVFLSGEPPADPVEYLTRESGEQALRFLIITLAMTPLRILTQWSAPLKLRRMFGLFAFFYTAGHFAVWLFLDLQLDFALVWDDIVERNYIAVGFAALLILIPLAATSNNFSIKKLGGKKWTALHRAAYAATLLGAIHFLWLTRGDDLAEPIMHLLIICTLLSVRLPAAKARLTNLIPKLLARGGGR